ncbi:carnosine N-methyltransferase isoform X3 [Capsella rubella]|uniref:carnosine N-methyltransferase isoform X3 n=1 Tax=Capsella rubella TaxID=81985 RepID=UPI000CD4CB45|nr:carnosine N-methyltransferase isoform X3 [Capsella rubella]
MSEPETEPAPEIVTDMATETETPREVPDEEEEKIRRLKKLEEALEAKSLRRIISAYLNYPEASEEDLKRWERSYRKLSPAHKALVPHFPMKFQRLRRCISANSFFIFNMLQAFDPPIDLSQELDGYEGSNSECAPHEKYTLDERHDSSCQPALTNSCTYQEESKHIHVPKAGVSVEELQRKEAHDHSPKDQSENDGGQLNHDHGSELCAYHDWLDSSIQTHVPLVDVDKVRCIIRNIVRDWAAEGQRERDECYKPILEELDLLFPDRQKESTQVPGEWTIYPWIHSNCNSLSDNDQLRPIAIPDIHPASAGITEGFSMCGGDFVEVYNESTHAGMWDAVVTCFFIDTAHNIIEYIETISKILKDGGVWINLGPLLYHFADTYGHENEMSIELSLEDVKRVASHYGFVIEKERTIETTYTTNPRAMMQNRYYTAFWTMRKKCAILATT